ncbi:HECT domain-containing protein [Forsythia ovata]|uniref:HECT domain-containing protein n=1 Tax=Forsythia ovata TaxID=205694 RepID=A0ABD1UTQ8_9LAMI
METRSQKRAEANTSAVPSSSSFGPTTRATKRAHISASNAATVSSSTTSTISTRSRVVTRSKDSVVSSTLMDPTPKPLLSLLQQFVVAVEKILTIKILITKITPIQIKARRKSMKAGLGIEIEKLKRAQG